MEVCKWNIYIYVIKYIAQIHPDDHEDPGGLDVMDFCPNVKVNK